jgi:hypothetical protein
LYFYDEWISRWIFPTPLWRVGSCNPCKIPMNCHISCRGVWWKKHVYFGCWGSLGNTNCRGETVPDGRCEAKNAITGFLDSPRTGPHALDGEFGTPWILVKPQQPSRYFHRRASQATQGFLDHMKTRDAVPRLWGWVLGECEGVHVCLNDIHISNISIYIYVLLYVCVMICTFSRM